MPHKGFLPVPKAAATASAIAQKISCRLTCAEDSHCEDGIQRSVRIGVVREFAQKIDQLRLWVARVLQRHRQRHGALHVGICVLQNVVLHIERKHTYTASCRRKASASLGCYGGAAMCGAAAGERMGASLPGCRAESFDGSIKGAIGRLPM